MGKGRQAVPVIITAVGHAALCPTYPTTATSFTRRMGKGRQAVPVIITAPITTMVERARPALLRVAVTGAWFIPAPSQDRI